LLAGNAKEAPPDACREDAAKSGADTCAAAPCQPPRASLSGAREALESRPRPAYGSQVMPVQCRPALAFLAGPLLAGCAGATQADYPSLAIRDVERVAGTLAPAAAPAPPPAPASATLNEAGELRARASEIHARFLAAAPEARSRVGAARGAEPGAESWARAQVALAGLEAIRSQAMVPMADLDRLHVDAATQGQETVTIAAARDEVAALIAEEDRLIASLQAGLR
jgi:hypothetical protein